MTTDVKKFREHFQKISGDYIDALDSTAVKFDRANLDKTIYQSYYLLGIERACELMLPYLNKSSSFLDYGNGVSCIGAAMCEYVGEVYATDILKEDWNIDLWNKMSHKYNFQQYIISGDEPLPHEDSTFDAMCMYAVLEHIDSTEAGIYEKFKEMVRVVKPGGYIFVFKTPQKYSYTECLAKLLKIPHHKVLLDTKKFRENLDNFGLEEVVFKKYTVLPDFQPVKFLETLQNKNANIYYKLDALLNKFPLANFLSHDFMAVLQKKL